MKATFVHFCILAVLAAKKQTFFHYFQTFYFVFFQRCLNDGIRELKQWQRRCQQKRKEAIGLDWQNNHFALHFFCVWKCLISPIVEDVNTRQWLSFSFPELRYSLLEFHSRKDCQHLTNWSRQNKCNKVWCCPTSLI